MGIPLHAWLGWGIVVGIGAAIWFGAWRNWTRARAGKGYLLLGFPWFALGVLCLGVRSILPSELADAVPQGAANWCAVGLGLFGVFVGMTGYPRWALPRWFREQELDDGQPS